MDVTRTPLGQRSTLAAHADVVARAAPQPAPIVEVTGTTDGPDIMLASGVRLRRTRVGNARVTEAALAQAIRGVQLLPVAHQQLLARMGVVIELVPVRHLEQVEGTTRPVVGATTVVGEVGVSRPTRIRIATQMGSLPVAPQIREVVQHEIGHAIAVTANQDRSEAAAEAYAERY